MSYCSSWVNSKFRERQKTGTVHSTGRVIIRNAPQTRSLLHITRCVGRDSQLSIGLACRPSCYPGARLNPVAGSNPAIRTPLATSQYRDGGESNVKTFVNKETVTTAKGWDSFADLDPSELGIRKSRSSVLRWRVLHDPPLPLLGIYSQPETGLSSTR